MAGLIHNGTAVHFPCATPRSGIVIFLRPAPEYVNRNHVNFAKPSFVYSTFDCLQRWVQPILFDDKKEYASIITGPNHVQPFLPVSGHGLFGHYMPTILGRHNGL